MVQTILAVIDRLQTSYDVFENALVLAQATGASLLLLHIISAQEKAEICGFGLSHRNYQKYGDASDIAFASNSIDRTSLSQSRSEADKPIMHCDLDGDRVKQEHEAESWQENRKPLLNYLRAYQAIAAAVGVSVKLTQHSGNPERIIFDVAQRCNADLILLGTLKTCV